MRSRFSLVAAAVDALVRDRRPRRFRADADEIEMIRVAAALRSGHQGAGDPAPTFVDGLARRLRREVEEEERAAAGRPRRRFLQASGIAAAAAVVGVVGDRILARPEAGEGRATDAELVPDEGRWVGVAAATDVAPGQLLRFTAGSVEGFVVNRGGAISAISAICTHRGCTLAGDTARQKLVCPCHGSAFAVDGTPLRGDYAVAALPRIRSRVREGTVEVFIA